MWPSRVVCLKCAAGKGIDVMSLDRIREDQVRKGVKLRNNEYRVILRCVLL